MYTYKYIRGRRRASMANLRTKTLDFGGLDSSIILSLWGGIPRSIGNSPDNFNLSRGIFVGMILVERLGVNRRGWIQPPANHWRLVDRALSPDRRFPDIPFDDEGFANLRMELSSGLRPIHELRTWISEGFGKPF